MTVKMRGVKIASLIIVLAGYSSAQITCPGFPGYCSESFPGQTCVVVCSKGRNNVPLCQEDGTWTDVPRCIEHEPGVKQQVPGLCPGIAGYCSEGYLDRRCTFKCPIGPDINSICTQDGTWEPYPTCQGDLRENQDGCNPCPGPNGRFRNRTAENILGINPIDSRPSLPLKQGGRVVRPTFAGNQAFGKLPSKKELLSKRPMASPFISQQSTRPPVRSSFIGQQNTRVQGLRPKSQPSISRFFIGPDGRIKTTLQPAETQQRPLEQQPSQLFQFGNPSSRPGVQQQLPATSGIPAVQRKILEDAIARLPASVGGGGQRGRRPLNPVATTTPRPNPALKTQSFANFPQQQPRKLPLPQINRAGQGNAPTPSREAPQVPQSPRRVPQTPKRVPQTPRRLPQTPGTNENLLPRIPQTPGLPKIPQTPGVNQPVTKKSREPISVKLFEEDEPLPRAGGSGDNFFGPFQVFDPNGQPNPIAAAPSLQTFPAIPKGKDFRQGPLPPGLQTSQDESEFGPFQIVPLKKK